MPDALAVFDFAESSLVTGARETTNVPSQALFLLNSAFATGQAQPLRRPRHPGYPAGANGGYAAQTPGAHHLRLLARLLPPADRRRAPAATNFFSRFPANWLKGDNRRRLPCATPTTAKAAWTSFCRALFASAEFRYLN